MEDELKAHIDEALAAVSGAGSVDELESVRVRYLGKKGLLTLSLREVGKLPHEERPAAGQARNEARRLVLEALQARECELGLRREAAMKLDVTLPGRSVEVGRRHPLTLVTDEILAVFGAMGFEVAEGPEIETEYYNYEALNFPPDHPARDEQDCFYITHDVLLRTHTSPVQIRVMKREKPPVAIVAAGRCFRRDATDASHSAVFHQVEGLFVDRGVTFADLKGVLEAFSREMFGARTCARFRPDFFPFTEPSAEMAISCFICGGKGCSTCSRSGWLEILGAGMVHPEVFKGVGYDPEEVTGFAFGMGVERIAMLKYGISDIRAFLENDVRLLQQF